MMGFGANMSKASTSVSRHRIVTRPLTADDWPNVERLFGDRGACGGCWCMYWRLARGGQLWEQKKGAPNKRAFKQLVTTGRVMGCLAFHGDEPVGWCCVGPRKDFPRIERVRALRGEWSESTWSVTCFYIPSAWRQRGVATKLLKEAIAIARDNGACELEGYPVRPSPTGSGVIPGAFAWTGVPRLFEKQGFDNTTQRPTTRDVFVKRFRK